MKFKIHYTLPDGTEDSVVLIGDSIEELQERASAEITKRNATDPWSEQVS